MLQIVTGSNAIKRHKNVYTVIFSSKSKEARKALSASNDDVFDLWSWKLCLESGQLNLSRKLDRASSRIITLYGLSSAV